MFYPYIYIHARVLKFMTERNIKINRIDFSSKDSLPQTFATNWIIRRKQFIGSAENLSRISI